MPPKIMRELGPEGYQMRLDYSVSNLQDPDFLGYAPPGVKTSEAQWTLYAFTFDGSSRVTLRQVAVKVAWDNRASVTYS